MPACLNLIPIWLSFCVNRGITGWLWLKAGLSRHKEVGRRTFFLPQLPGRRFARWPRGANASAETSMPPAASFDDPASITFCVSRVIHELIKTFGMRLRGITVHVGAARTIDDVVVLSCVRVYICQRGGWIWSYFSVTNGLKWSQIRGRSETN